MLSKIWLRDIGKFCRIILDLQDLIASKVAIPEAEGRFFVVAAICKFISDQIGEGGSLKMNCSRSDDGTSYVEIVCETIN
jgi:hypothetical protein